VCIAGLASWRKTEVFLTGPAECRRAAMSVCLAVCHNYKGRLLCHFLRHINDIYIVEKFGPSATQRCKYRVCTVQHRLMQLTCRIRISTIFQKQAQKMPKVFGCAQIISLLNTEQNCGWVDLNLASNPDLTCLSSSSVISVVEALMYSLMSMLYISS
jgi:hypothetical protein